MLKLYNHQTSRIGLVNLPKLKLKLKVYNDLIKLLEFGDLDSNKTEHNQFQQIP